MTWPNWSIARNRYRQVPPTLTYVSSTCQRSPTRCRRALAASANSGAEPLNPSVHGKVVDLDAPFGEELLDIAVGQAEPQVPPDGQGDDLGREPVAGECRARRRSEVSVSVRSHDRSLPDEPTGHQCNSASWGAGGGISKSTREHLRLGISLPLGHTTSLTAPLISNRACGRHTVHQHCRPWPPDGAGPLPR